jgi:hypothetical protein
MTAERTDAPPGHPVCNAELPFFHLGSGIQDDAVEAVTQAVSASRGFGGYVQPFKLARFPHLGHHRHHQGRHRRSAQP